jgi:predicted nuclease with TOPRIM domain
MTNEEIQRMMEFIIKQQESFSENMEQLRGNVEQLREVHTRGEARLSRLETAFVNLYNAVTEIGKAQKELTQTVSGLAESQAHTDQRINVLIDILSEGRNGKSKG